LVCFSFLSFSLFPLGLADNQSKAEDEQEKSIDWNLIEEDLSPTPIVGQPDVNSLLNKTVCCQVRDHLRLRYVTGISNKNAHSIVGKTNSGRIVSLAFMSHYKLTSQLSTRLRDSLWKPEISRGSIAMSTESQSIKKINVCSNARDPV